MGGKYNSPDCWMNACPELKGRNMKEKGDAMHVAFKETSQKMVQDFYKAALRVCLPTYPCLTLSGSWS
jgi:hypothetical protein